MNGWDALLTVAGIAIGSATAAALAGIGVITARTIGYHIRTRRARSSR